MRSAPRLRLTLALLAWPLLGALCDGAATPLNQTCMTDADCDDGLFCNGLEFCSGETCFRDPPPICDDGVECTLDACSEALKGCEHLAPDNDLDGYADANCPATLIGLDCDDQDPNRYPGAPEICDLEGIDEDCDPSTFAGPEGDRDGDGFVATGCCQIDPLDGALRCGQDCDDDNSALHPGTPEICNGLDEDCDEEIDEGVTVMLFEDLDRDGFGAPGTGAPGCLGELDRSQLDGDCDDGNPAIVPGAMVCVDLDNVDICEADGTWSAAVCVGDTSCYPQANGTGVCGLL